MKAFIACLFIALTFTVYAQVLQEPNLNYSNNYLKEEVYKGLKNNLKYEANGNILNLTHQSKAVDIYASSDIFPRSDFDNYIRDFDMSFDFSFLQSADKDNFLGVSFLISPDENIDWKDSAAFVYFIITPEGMLYSFAKNLPYSNQLCYTCPTLLKEKDLKKLYSIDNVKGESIAGYAAGTKNSFALNRKNDTWVLSINGKKIKEFNAMAKGRFSSRMGPIFVLKGKTSIQLQNLQESYGHQNDAMLKYLKDMKSSGAADLTGSCIKGTSKVIYELTTNRGIPSVKITWKPDPAYNITEWVYFDFQETDDYGVYKYRGLSSKTLIMFGERGEAKNIKMKPDKGEISFDFYFSNGVSSRKSGNYTYYTSQYCPITISRSN